MLPSPNLSQIERLVAAARHGQWSVEQVYANGARPELAMWVPRAAVVTIVGLLRAGERTAEIACRRLAMLLPAGLARDFVVLQAADESRHAAVYDRYIDLLGLRPGPFDEFEPIRAAVNEAGRSAHAVVLINHLILEDAAVSAHQWLARHLPCPLLRRLTRGIGRDEARHVAFGRWFTRHMTGGIPERARRADLAWARDVRARCTERIAVRMGTMSSLLSRAVPGYATQHERIQDATLEALTIGARDRSAVPSC
jgi:hypothetical protein